MSARRIFKSARELLASACVSLAEPFARELLACARLLHECDILASVCPCTYVTQT